MIRRHLPISVIIVLLLTLFIPSNSLLATKWVHQFVVWEGYVYTLEDEIITDVREKIGEVTAYSDMNQLPGNFSNVFQKGTPYYSIKEIDTNESIAIKVGKDRYQIADRESEYLVRDTEGSSANEYYDSSFTKHLLAFFDNLLKWF
ncbi:hypothetical protein ABID52_000398 [Fictibacillus halophilus]|uniref:Uncharacterized protein n=1 Tax=Fictibacillus halophilus TaxID=1610490 RepID=A0ABV2LGY5_9BACL|nr:hypothetical protein [Fictibacillus halophilus]